MARPLIRFLLGALLLLPGAARAADARWDEYQLIMWQDRTPAQFAGLPALGFTGTKLRATGGIVDEATKAPRRAAGLPWYLENIATDFYAAYHRSVPNKPVTFLFDEAKRRYRAGDPAAFFREPSLVGPAALEPLRARLAGTVAAQRADRPLFYNLGDETGIADLAAAWDFDLAPASLDAFRTELQAAYPSLDALNAQWGSSFARWSDVRSETTDAAIRRGDENFSAWSDFKAFMDGRFAAALRAGRDAVHAADPEALAAIEGAQVPGWGGYDYRQVAPALDVMEIYDFGGALDLATAFNPNLIPLRTSFASGPREAHAAWRSLLHGGRGAVVWDENDDVVRADGTPGPRGAELAALMARLRPVARRLRALAPDPDPVAVFYSPASFRVQWLLDRRAGDHDWAARDAEREYDDNAERAARREITTRLAALAVQPRFVAGSDLPGLAASGVRVLHLPHAIALSDAEVAAIRAFAAAGGTVLASTEPGLFDGHGKRRAAPPLPDVPHPEAVRTLGRDDDTGVLAGLAGLLSHAGAPPRVELLAPDGARATGLEGRWFRGPDGPLLAVQPARPWSAAPTVTVRWRDGAAIQSALDGIEPLFMTPSGVVTRP